MSKCTLRMYDAFTHLDYSCDDVRQLKDGWYRDFSGSVLGRKNRKLVERYIGEIESFLSKCKCKLSEVIMNEEEFIKLLGNKPYYGAQDFVSAGYFKQNWGLNQFALSNKIKPQRIGRTFLYTREQAKVLLSKILRKRELAKQNAAKIAAREERKAKKAEQKSQDSGICSGFTEEFQSQIKCLRTEIAGLVMLLRGYGSNDAQASV
jgi:hypothetical protein